MLLFQNKGGSKQEKNPGADRKELVIARAICKAQTRAAEWLGRRYRVLPFRTRTLCLLLFCLLLGGASGWILAEAIVPGTKPAAVPGSHFNMGVPAALPPEHHRQPPQRLPDSLRHPGQQQPIPPLK